MHTSRKLFFIVRVAMLLCVVWAPYASAEAVPAPEATSNSPKLDLALASVSAVALDLADGELLIAKRPDLPLSIASVTKVMTAMVVLDSEEPLDEWLRIHPWNGPLAKNAFSRIRVESKARRKDLLRICLLYTSPSPRDA